MTGAGTWSPFGLFVMVALCAGGCAGYAGTARSVTPEVWTQEGGWVAVQGVKLLRQQGDEDCGPTALAMVVRYYQPALAVEEVTRGFSHERQASAAELRDRARALRLSAFVIEGTVDDLVYELKRQRPMIVGVAKPTATDSVSHFEVLVAIHPQTQRVITLDPAVGWQQNSLGGFLREWLATGSVLITVLPAPPPGRTALDPAVAGNP